MNIAAYFIVFFLALASGCAAGSSCEDANNELCNRIDRGLILAFIDDGENKTNLVYSVPIAQNGTPSPDPIWSDYFPTFAELIRVEVDNILQQAYLYHSSAKTIYKNPKYNFGNSTKNKWTTLHQGISEDALKIAVDWLSHNIYWTDPKFKWIMVQSPLVNDTSMYRVLIHENLEGPRALALDPKEALLFWSDVGTFTKIEVSSLSGRNRKTLLFSNLLDTYSMVADYEDRRLYFVDALRNTVETVTYDGEDRKILKVTVNGDFSDITVYKDYLYVTRYSSIAFINKTNGLSLGTIEKEGFLKFYTGAAVFHNDTQSSSVSAICENYGCEHICLTDTAGATCICKDGYNLNQDMKTCSLNNKYFHRALVFSNKSSICIVDIRVLSDFVFDPVCVLETTGTKYMIMDTDGRKIVIANDTAIYWASVDNPELRRLTEPNGTISGMAWDGYDRIVYWTEEDTGIIWKKSVESEQAQVFIEGLTNPRDILILPHDRLVYWISDRNGSTIESSYINSSNRHVILNSEDSMHWKSLSYDQYNKRNTNPYIWKLHDNLTSCMNVKKLRRKISFLAISDENKTRVISFNRDGSKSTQAYSIHFDTIINRLEIYKGYMLLTEQEDEETLIMIYTIYDHISMTSGVFNGTGAISDIKIFDENKRQNETGPCYIFNGECEQICIANGISRICKCTFSFRLAGDGKTCTSDPIKDNFMLVYNSEEENIYQISLNDQSVQGIKAKGINPIYNPVNDLLIWTPYDGNELFSMHLNGTGKKNVELSRTVSQFNVDYSTGNLYHASQDVEGENYISVLSPDGKHRDLCDGLDQINGLVIYPSEGYMFYLQDYSLVRSFMDGTNSETLLDELESTSGLTIDYKTGFLYWIEVNRESRGYNIEKCKTDGSNHSTLFKMSRFYYPSELDVYEDYLFIASHKQSNLRKLNMSASNEMTEFTVQGALGEILQLNIYSSAAQNKNAFCSDRNGNCSTFCLPVPGGVTCACEDDVDLMEGSTSVCSDIS